MEMSRLARSIAESPTLKLNEKARVLKEQGEAVINLTVGEPKNKVPQTAVDGVNEILQKGNIKYSPTSGDPALKKAIISYTEQNYGRAVKPANIIISAGAKHSLSTLMLTLLDPGDEIILIAPYWVSYPEMAKLAGAKAIVVQPAADFQPAMKEIERAVNPRTKAILVNSPNNPSSVVYGEEFIAGIVEFCETKGIYLIMDDIYHKLIFDGKSHIPAYKFTAKDIESSRIILINGISKSYGMTGFRVGWTIANKDIVSTMTNIQGQTITCVSTLLQSGAEGVLTGSQVCVGDLLATIEKNRTIVMQKISGIPGVRAIKPQGAFYCFPDFRHYSADSMKLCEFLLEKVSVLTVPGKEFGMDGYLRLSFAGNAKEIEEGIERIRWALDPNGSPEIYIGERKVIRNWKG